MADKRTNKNSKNTKERIALASQKGNSNRIYVQKHSDVMEYLYESESSEIKAMIESAEKIAGKKR